MASFVLYFSGRKKPTREVQVMLIDTTLREGAQLYGVNFSPEARTEIVNGLLRLGIEEIELGWIGMDGIERASKKAHARRVSTVFSVWSPCREQCVKQAAELGFKRINIGVPVSDEHVSMRLGMKQEELLERITTAVMLARMMGMEVSVGLEDVSRANWDFAVKVANHAETAGAFRVRLPDTVGVLNPFEMSGLVRFFKANLNISLAIHCHDDFGMATANTITALASGADYADVSILGIGERSGIAALEEVAAYLKLKENKREYNLESLPELCAHVARESRVEIPRTKAIAGSDIFACETGLHLHGLGCDPTLFEPYPPELVGASRKAGYGKKIGQAAVNQILNKGASTRDKREVAGLLKSIRHMAGRLGRPLYRQEVIELSESESEKQSQN